MFKKILLPLDLTDKHQAALNVAVDLARQSKGRIVLLHVIEQISGVSVNEEAEFFDRLERSARAHLERFGSGLSRRRISWTGEVRTGNRAAEVAQYATETRADLIVLTAPQINPSDPTAGWGSLSYKVGILARCPVLLVK
jgi:nucleotide-binding universal stress UspA family protein